MLTSQQQELLKLLERGASHDFELIIKVKEGSWHLDLVSPQKTTHGVGETFSESWQDSKLKSYVLADIADPTPAISTFRILIEK